MTFYIGKDIGDTTRVQGAQIHIKWPLLIVYHASKPAAYALIETEQAYYRLTLRILHNNFYFMKFFNIDLQNTISNTTNFTGRHNRFTLVAQQT